LKKIEDILWDEVNIRYIAHPMSYHKNAETMTQALEYIWDKAGTQEYYKAIAKVYESENYTAETLYDYAESIWLNIIAMKEAVDNKDYSTKVTTHGSNSSYVWLSSLTHIVAIHPETNKYLKLRYYYDAEYIIESIQSLDTMK
jgi:hypothetical protein